MMIPRYYEDLSILHDNTMPMRSYYIPASQKMNTLIEHREDSDRFQLLNGVWKFQYYKSVYDLKEAFYRTSFNTKDFDDITVPGVWQIAGYDSPQYTNIRYPFPFDPPYLPQDIPWRCCWPRCLAWCRRPWSRFSAAPGPTVTVASC